MNVFSVLDESIRRILGSEGLLEPTAPQQEAMPGIMEGKNILLIAPTGMGKTEAAVLPLLHRLLEIKREERENLVKKITSKDKIRKKEKLDNIKKLEEEVSFINRSRCGSL